jgi:enoyl-[acyl-carrier-protein] reductase (NADH)
MGCERLAGKVAILTGAEEVAAEIRAAGTPSLFLASDESSFITGHVIRCDGGQLVHLPHHADLRAAGVTTTV